MPNTSSAQLLSVLKENFGYSSFRPLQQEIIQDVLAQKDIFALLPTGGGKSLCFQLPALIQPGLTVVVSPLIALMKDQVDALEASGIAATFLNSSLNAETSRERFRNLHAGKYKLLYVAPERLMMPSFLEILAAWKIQLFAIDEAHCISEWGHDFRPEYRELRRLKKLFPQTPILALTATATERVQKDILQQLEFKDPRCYLASFNRPNLSYRIIPKEKAYRQVLDFIRCKPQESGIIYCQSRKSTESLAERLNADGIKAKAYHAGLEGETRAQHQDMFLRDKIQVICATVAFGMGINKSNVRFVLHYDLPKNIEAYYQETGRAGRDGLPSECLMLFSAADVAKILRFIEDKSTVQEREIARRQLQQIVDYAEAHNCRRRVLLQYFGEDFTPENCAGCDNCLSPQTLSDGTLTAQKFLSCLYRIREKSGFGVGMNHVVEVLTGGEGEKILRLGHQNLSTYKIGSELSRSQWKHLGRQLIRLGLVVQSEDVFRVLSLSQKGAEVLKNRSTVMLNFAPVSSKEKQSFVARTDYDEILFTRLRALRKTLSDQRDVPAYIIFSDAALRQMAQDYPTRPQEFAKISGVGEKKLKEFGEIFQTEIRDHLSEHPRESFQDLGP